MTYFGRASLPSNYEDFAVTTGQALLLPTPEPQYLFAQMAIGNRIRMQALNAGAPTAQQFVTAAGGGAPVDQELDRMVRAADIYPEAIQAVDVFGPQKGDTIKFQRPVFSTGGLTESARELTNQKTISTTGMAAQMEEVPIVLKQYHGPYSSDGSAVQPYEIANFDSKFKANKLQLTGIVSLHLKRDYTRWLDAVIRARMSASRYTTLANASLADCSSFVAGGGQKFSLEAIFRARKALSDREWRHFPNGRYLCVVPTSFNTDMLEDVDYREMSKVHMDGRNLIYGYIGSVQDIDFLECTTTKQYVATDVVAGDETGTVASGVVLEEALLFGPGGVGVGTAAPEPEGTTGPVVRFADNTNYGTIAQVIWYALHAFETIDQRAIQRIIAQST